MSQLTLEQALELAISHHGAGRLAQAESIYRQILAHEPRHAPTLRLLAILAHGTGRADEAIDLLRRATAAAPEFGDAYATLGAMLAMRGRLPEAADALRRAHALLPDDPETMVNLANVLQQQDQIEESIRLYQRAIKVRPEIPEAHFNLGRALRRVGRTAKAADAYQRAIQFKPDYAEARNELSQLLNEIGAAMAERDRHAEAIAAFERALSLRPDSPDVLNNLGNVLLDLDRLDEAAAVYRRAQELRPDHPGTWNNLGTVLHRAALFDQAEAAYRRALALAPEGHASARFNLGWNLLLRGNYVEGFAAHEARLDPSVNPGRDAIPRPLWTGSANDDLRGLRILLTPEQGFGDTIQFVRYAPLMARRGAYVIVQCQPQLRRLLANLPGVARIVGTDELLPLDEFDVHCPMMSLPARFHTTIDSVHATVPYLSPDPLLVAEWRDRLNALGPDALLNVGLVWSGNAKPRNRSIPAAALEPLAHVPGVRFHALQKPDTDNPAEAPPPSLNVTDWSARLTDFADTAALIEILDQVITIDTAAAHLAGALAKPTWVLLQHVPDWRWLLNRSDSPWYPTLQLFRQPAPGQWGPVVEAVAAELRQWTQG